MGQHNIKASPKKARVSAQMQVQEVEQTSEDLDESPPYDSGPHGWIISVMVTKVSIVPDAILSPEAQKGYQFADTKLILMKGIVANRPVRVLFDTGSTHNVSVQISSRSLSSRLHLQSTITQWS